MLYTLQNEDVNINYLAKLDFLDLCLLGESGTGKTRTAKHLGISRSGLIKKMRWIDSWLVQKCSTTGL